jgi:glycosyltransferase involved in cell wall biosynthesis
MKFSLIISTKGRVDQLKTLFRSLQDQTCQDFEVIIADQNEDDRLDAFLKESNLKQKPIHFKSSGGASRGRNQGLARASGEILSFPDDDCAYVPRLLEQMEEFFQQHPEYGYVCGRSFADDGGDSVSKHAKVAGEIEKYQVHSQCIEFALFIRRRALGETRFDENMGVGADTPWHSDEGPDLLLRLKEKGERGLYDPRFTVWHPRPVTRYDDKEIDRTYRYACGNGYFYRKHHYAWWFFAYQMMRTIGGVLVGLATLKVNKARLYGARLRGRWRGWLGGRDALLSPAAQERSASVVEKAV